MSIYSNENISKILKISPCEFLHLVQNPKISVRENIGKYSNLSDFWFILTQQSMGGGGGGGVSMVNPVTCLFSLL